MIFFFTNTLYNKNVLRYTAICSAKYCQNKNS